MVASFKEYGEFKENPTFKYPDDSIRFLDAQRQRDITSGKVSPASNEKDKDKSNYKIHRGYIRNLQPASLKYVPQYKCRFQFNPQEISQSVSMREDIYNPILLTPEQLSQPIGGTVNFQFDLFFDRSHELASDLDRGAVVFDMENGAEGADSIYAAQRFGVFADLRMLYSVIGQGLTNELVQTQIANIKNFYETKFKRDQAYTSSTEDGDKGNTTETSTDVEAPTGVFDSDFNVSDLTKMFESNLGNSAFLIPNPVRIVFSDLFMVDGFVTGTRVDFLKFNNYMTPMQCRVAMSVNAMYIGFAKTRTFLSTTIESARETLLEEFRDSTKASIEIEKALLSINPFIIAFESYLATAGSTQVSPYWDRAANGQVTGQQLSSFLIPDSKVGQVVRRAYTGFKKIRPIEGDGNDIDGILKLFEDVNRSPFTISYDWEMKVYGKINQNDSGGQGWTQQEATSMLASGPGGTALYRNENMSDVVALYSGSETASSKDEWGSGMSGDGAKQERIRRRTYSTISNGGAYELDTDSYLNNINNSYYIVTWDITITIQVGSLTIVYKPSPSLTPKVRRGTDSTGYSGSITSTNYSRGVA